MEDQLGRPPPPHLEPGDEDLLSICLAAAGELTFQGLSALGGSSTSPSTSPADNQVS